jgi:hypothetical protein
LLNCWHGHLLNSGRRLHLNPAERHEPRGQAIRLDPFEDQGTGFAFEPLSKKDIALGGLWNCGQRASRWVTVLSLSTARPPGSPAGELSTNPQTVRLPYCFVTRSGRLQDRSQWVRGHSYAHQSRCQEFRGQLSRQLTSNYFKASTRSLSVTLPD